MWKQVGQWQIRIDRTLNYGCFMIGAYVGGTVLRFGFDRQQQNGYLMLGDDAWTSLEEGKDYNIRVQFDSDSPWDGTARAIRLGTAAVVLQLPFSDSNMITEISRKQLMRVYYNGRPVAQLALTGSYAATRELINCQVAVEDARKGTTAPTSNNAPTSNDPFAASRQRSSRDPFSPQ